MACSKLVRNLKQKKLVIFLAKVIYFLTEEFISFSNGLCPRLHIS